MCVKKSIFQRYLSNFWCKGFFIYYIKELEGIMELIQKIAEVIEKIYKHKIT